MIYCEKNSKGVNMITFYLSLITNEEDKATITRIYDTYLSWMLKIAFHYLKNDADAEDAVNDVFLSIIGGNCTVPTNNENETKSYLFICIRNSALNLKKLNSKHKTVNFDEFFNLPTVYNLEEDVLKKDSYCELLDFVNKMPSIYKDVLTLYISFEKTLKEISVLLNLPFKTVETRFRRGKKILKNKFGDLDI